MDRLLIFHQPLSNLQYQVNLMENQFNLYLSCNCTCILRFHLMIYIHSLTTYCSFKMASLRVLLTIHLYKVYLSILILSLLVHMMSFYILLQSSQFMKKFWCNKLSASFLSFIFKGDLPHLMLHLEGIVFYPCR